MAGKPLKAGRALARVLLAVLLAACAKQGLPPGGPEDREGPQVLEMIPDPGSTNVSRGQPIVFTFSESMDRRSVERALFFTPDISQLLRPSWRGDRLRLIPRESLRENTTFVITLGADAADQRRNRMGRSVTLAFSTGETIDDAAVAGWVLEEGRPVSGAWIWIYPIDDESERELADPLLASAEEPIYPLYVKQADEEGRFEAGHMAQGSYRVFAFRDTDGNRLYDAELDLLAVPPTDIRFETQDDRLEYLNMSLAPRDTTGPILRSASAPNRDYVNLRFSEQVAAGSLPVISLEPYLPEDDPEAAAAAVDIPPVRILRSYMPAGAPATLVVQADGLEAGRRYRARLVSAGDLLGNPARESPRPITFSMPAEPDTTTPLIAATIPPDSSRGLNQDGWIQLFFSTEIDTAGLLEWTLTGSDTLALTRRWLDPRTVLLQPNSEPTVDGWYTLWLAAEELRSWTGLRGPTTADTLVWQGSPPLGRGTLRITVEGDSLPPGGSYQVVISGAGSETIPRTVLTLAEPGSAFTPELPEGAYLVWGFADANGNGVFDSGRAKPFQLSERVAAIIDTQYVRNSFESVVGTPLRLVDVVRRSPQPAPPDTSRGGTVIPP